MKSILLLTTIFSSQLFAQSSNIIRSLQILGTNGKIINSSTDAEITLRTPDHYFIPSGFDTNDNTQITISGHFPNLCYKMGPSGFAVDYSNRRILIQDIAYKSSHKNCLSMIVGYSKTIDIGRVAIPGEYDVAIITGADNSYKNESKIQIGGAKSSGEFGTDSILYAPISSAFVAKDQGGAFRLFIGGTYPNECMKINNIEIIHNSPNVIEVLPRASYIKDKCKPKPIPFMESKPLGSQFQGQVLIHVRSLNGGAFNILHAFPEPE